MNPVVEIQSLTYRYPKAERNALTDFSLSVPKGSFFGLLGPNGAGKSTLMSFLSGQKIDHSGSVKIFGKSTSEMKEDFLRIGYAPQDLALFLTLSAYDNLLFFSKLCKIERPNAKIEEVLQTIGLLDRKNAKVNTFSGGMKRRLNLGVALLNDPELLILDEPTTGVDLQSRDMIFENILSQRKSGVTLIYTTHYLEEIERICGDIGVIHGGRILFQNSVAEFKSKYGRSSVEESYRELLKETSLR